MDLKERLLSSAVLLLPSPAELVVSSSWGTPQLNLGSSTRHPQQVQQLSQPLLGVQPHTRETAQVWPGMWSQRMLQSLPVQPSSHRSPVCGRSCAAALSPCRALSFINSLGAIPPPWLLIWLGVMGGRGRGCPFFCFLNWGLPECHFLLCILSLQSGSIMIAHYVNIKDNWRALIKANSVSFFPLPPSLLST